MRVELEEGGRAIGKDAEGLVSSWCFWWKFPAFWAIVYMDLWSMFYGFGISFRTLNSARNICGIGNIKHD